MAKGKKKKKDVDFQKVKLRVGRKLKKDDRETRAEFKSRKIILKRQPIDEEVKPTNALIKHSTHITHDGKLSMLNHFQQSMRTGQVKDLNKPIMDGLAKFLVDRGEQVRLTSMKCLKTCYRHTKENQLSTKDFLESIKPYLDCAYTHVSPEIVNNCRVFLQYLVSQNDFQIFEPLMEVILNRYETGSVTAADQKLALSLRHLFSRGRQKQEVEKLLRVDQVEPLIYTHTNFVYDFDQVIHATPSSSSQQTNTSGLHEVTLASLMASSGGILKPDKGVVEKYLNTVQEGQNLPDGDDKGKAGEKRQKPKKRGRTALTRFAQPLVTFD